MSTSTPTDRMLWPVVAVLAVLVLLPVLLLAAAVPMGMMGTWAGHGMGGTWADHGMGGATAPVWWGGLSLVWLVVLLGGGYLLVRRLGGAVTADAGADDPAIAALRRAYARGDLTDEEYEARRERLERED